MFILRRTGLPEGALYNSREKRGREEKKEKVELEHFRPNSNEH